MVKKQFNPGTADNLNEAVKLRYEANENTNEFSDSEKEKLNNVEQQATRNFSDSYLLSRINHVGQINISDVNDLEDELDDKLSFDELSSVAFSGSYNDLSNQLQVFSTDIDGLVPVSPGGDARFLRADGTWSTPPINDGSESSDVTVVGTPSDGDYVMWTSSSSIKGISGIPWNDINDKPTITSGSGLNGGGTLFSDVTLSVDGTVARIDGDYTGLRARATTSDDVGLNNVPNEDYRNRLISTGDGLNGGGDLSADRTLAVDETVVRTTGDQSISGAKTFSSPVTISKNLADGEIAMDLDLHRGFDIRRIGDADSSAGLYLNAKSGSNNWGISFEGVPLVDFNTSGGSNFYGEVNAVSYGGDGVTQSATDTTAGRILKVGDHGLGATSGNTPELSNIDDQDTPTGMYGVTTGSTGTRPSETSSFAFVFVERQALSGIKQTWTNSNSSLTAFRYASGGTWGAWRELYHTGNLVGTVSQSGGVPTGAVIERGANSNGEYVRFADGTQMCWQKFNMGSRTAFGSGSTVNPYRSEVVDWTFPASFSGEPSISTTHSVDTSNASARHGGAMYRFANSTEADSLQVGFISEENDDDAVFLSVRAVGRWF